MDEILDIVEDTDLLNLAFFALKKLGLSGDEIIKEAQSISPEEAEDILEGVTLEDIEHITDTDSLKEKKQTNLGKAGLILLAILALGGSLTSCDPAFGFNTMGYEYQQKDLDSVWTEISSFPGKMPTKNRFLRATWQSPQEFRDEGGGVCIGFTIAMMYELGPEAELVVTLTSDLYPDANPGEKHAFIRYKGEYLEPQLKGRYYPDFKPTSATKIYSFNDAMTSATVLGTRGIGTTETPEQTELKNTVFTTQMVPGKIMVN